METTPTTITLEDGATAAIGDRVFNYYDRFPVTIAGIDTDGWCYTTRDNGDRGPSLNGARMCSLATATAKGWMCHPATDAVERVVVDKTPVPPAPTTTCPVCGYRAINVPDLEGHTFANHTEDGAR